MAEVCAAVEGTAMTLSAAMQAVEGATAYSAANTGNRLERRADMFYWRGRYFSGLIDAEANALYDDPADSFAAAVGIESSLAKGLIQRIDRLTAASGDTPDGDGGRG